MATLLKIAPLTPICLDSQCLSAALFFSTVLSAQKHTLYLTYLSCLASVPVPTPSSTEVP